MARRPIKEPHIVQWVPTNRGWRIRVDIHGSFSDWPIQYPNGSIAYDFPERIPQYVKAEVARLYRQGPPADQAAGLEFGTLR
jgi:hypothetical protein